MIYISDTLPSYLDEYKLCELWFLTKFGIVDALKLSKSKFEEGLKSISIDKIGTYRILSNGNELLNIGDHWFVGDGYGRVIYSPDRNSQVLQEYKDGRIPISAKYEVSKKTS